MHNFRSFGLGIGCAALFFVNASWAHDEAAKPETMDFIITLIVRWLHILPAIVTVGGSIFMFRVLSPAASEVLDVETHKALRAAVMKRWKIILHTCIALFLLTGFYNYLAITRPLHTDDPQYHMLFGIKFLLAMVLFFIAICLTSSKNWAATFRNNAPFWSKILVLLGVLVVLIAGYMKVMPS